MTTNNNSPKANPNSLHPLTSLQVERQRERRKEERKQELWQQQCFVEKEGRRESAASLFFFKSANSSNKLFITSYSLPHSPHHLMPAHCPSPHSQGYRMSRVWRSSCEGQPNGANCWPLPCKNPLMFLVRKVTRQTE
eukprot:scaffold90911_cov24-Attheya_sp.AAC.1